MIVMLIISCIIYFYADEWTKIQNNVPLMLRTTVRVFFSSSVTSDDDDDDDDDDIDADDDRIL